MKGMTTDAFLNFLNKIGHSYPSEFAKYFWLKLDCYKPKFSYTIIEYQW